MAKADVSREDHALRDATVFLLNNQASDGSWYSQNGILSTRLATTTWVIISLPIAFERIGGIDTDLYLVFPDDVILSSSNPVSTDLSGNSYHWKLLGVMEEGKDVDLDLTLKSLLLGEERKVAQSATLTFTNTYTNETITIPIDIPAVTGTSPVTIDVLTDKTEYTSNEDVTITTSIINISSGLQTPTARITVEDSGGNLVAGVAEFPVDNLDPSSTRSYASTWNTGTTLSGDYLVRAELYEGGAFLTEDTEDFTILPERPVTSKVTTDKIKYNPNETVTITSTVQSESPNYIFEGLDARVTITNANGTELFTEENTIPILTPGQLVELKGYWNTSTNPKGTYTVTLEVFEGLEVLSASQTTFEILGSSSTGSGLTGTIAASPNPVYQGRDEILTYTITNKGNEDIPNLKIKVLIVNPDTQEIKNTFEGTINLPMNTTATGNFISPTTNLTPRIYLVILQVSSATITQPKTLASTTFEVKPGIEVTKRIPDVTNILVWVNDECKKDSNQESVVRGQDTEEREHKDDKEKDKKCIRIDLLENIIREAVTSYFIVYDKKEFERQLRNPFYTDILILGEHHLLEDHYPDELREQVYSGRGLISVLYLKHGEHHEGHGEDDEYDPLFGIRYKGHLSGDEHRVNILDSPISGAGALIAKGEAIKVEVDDINRVVAWIEGEGHHYKEQKEYSFDSAQDRPGIVINNYGLGKTIFYAFDLGLTINDENYNQIAAIIKNSITYVHRPPDITTFSPDQLIPVEITIKSLGGAFDLRITETYPSDIMIYDPSTGQWVTENPWIINMNLLPNETKTILYYALTPDRADTYTLKTESGYMENGIYNFYQNLSIDIVVGKSAASTTTNIITALKTLSVSEKERSKVSNAIKYIGNVQKRVIQKGEDIEKNIHDILKAIDSLLSINSADISSIRLMMDEILIMWESRYYFGLVPGI